MSVMDSGAASRDRRRPSIYVSENLMQRRISRKFVALAVGVPVVLAAGIALAYWTSSGSGSGNATTGTTTSITVNQTVSPTGLAPGGTVALSGNFTNTNTSKVYVTAVTASVTPFSVQPDVSKPACNQADFTITGTSLVGAEILPGAGVGAWSGLSLNMVNAATNQDNCKNVTVPITYVSN